MRTISVRLPSREFAGAMKTMREWLDENHYDTVSFVYIRDGNNVVLNVGFRAHDHAEAFSRRFADERAAA